jgi:hypothetical protein
MGNLLIVKRRIFRIYNLVVMKFMRTNLRRETIELRNCQVWKKYCGLKSICIMRTRTQKVCTNLRGRRKEKEGVGIRVWEV